MEEKDKRDALISEFCAVTSVDVERAQFYLESTGWCIELALQSFFDQQDEDSEPFSSAPIRPEVERVLNEGMSVPGEDKKEKPKKASDSKIATVNTLRQEVSSSDEEGQAYYAGGSEHSGQQMIGPGKKKNPNDIIQNVFNSAKEHGAKVMDRAELEAEQRSRNTFGGAGYKLGSDGNEQSPIVSPFAVPQPVNLCLKMWKSGFSVDDGPLRSYSEPENAQFLEAIGRGEIPRELIRSAGGSEVNLNMEDHRNEDFVAPKKNVQPFSGKGNRLGAAAPAMTSDTPVVANEAAELKIDESKPTTNVQVRLADGTRIVVKLNLTNSIRDIRNHICKLRPQFASQSFVLMTTFPKTQLTDETLTIEEAKLQNAVIVQTFN